MTPQPQKLSKQSGSITSPPSAPGGGFAGAAPMTPQPPEQEWIISDKDYYIALEYFHLEARPLSDDLKKERERVLDEVMQKLDYRFNDTERGRRGVETCREVIESMRDEP